jgi:hypothetical protein
MEKLDRITMGPEVMGGETLYSGHAGDSRHAGGFNGNGEGH